MADVQMNLDIDAEVAALAVELAGLANAGAQILAEEIRSLIQISEIPSEPGQPPHSTGPLRDSWKHSPAHRSRRNRDQVVAYAYSMASTDKGESLNEILDEGRGPVYPHPFLNSGIIRATARLDRLLQQTQSELVAAARNAMVG